MNHFNPLQPPFVIPCTHPRGGHCTEYLPSWGGGRWGVGQLAASTNWCSALAKRLRVFAASSTADHCNSVVNALHQCICLRLLCPPLNNPAHFPYLCQPLSCPACSTPTPPTHTHPPRSWSATWPCVLNPLSTPVLPCFLHHSPPYTHQGVGTQLGHAC